MFGVALEIKPSHFIQLRHEKKSVATGLFSQYIILPIVTLLLIVVITPPPGIALGMLLVAACPGGNASNFFSMLAGGHVALSVTLTAITSILAFAITPISFFTFSSLIPGLTTEIKSFDINFFDLFLNMTGILLLPLITGMLVLHYLPHVAAKIGKPIRSLSIILLIAFIVVALRNNFSVLSNHIFSIFWIVVLHNGIALLVAYFASKFFGNHEAVNRTVAIETAIQNSGLGLVLIFTFFKGNSEMAIVAAWWGIWHLVSGFAFAYYCKRKPIHAST
ncbi:MAG: bile acid:sodium symporter family protein [Flammeovirgaceae bacterium]|jgi:BASS family bile acid:Na+ symporter|nr:bile acid:sodium symporter family protein [Flammeovirgaceae bacterium]